MFSLVSPLSLDIPLRDCEPWCGNGKGHPDEHPEDRYCFSDIHQIPLSAHAPVRLGDRTWKHDWIDVWLRRGPQATEPRVQIGWETEPRGIEINFTLEEAAELRDALTRLLDQAGHPPA